MTMRSSLYLAASYLIASCLISGAAGLSPVGAQEQTFKKAVADDIFSDHPSMDRNAVVMPDEDAQPVTPFFSERPIGDASLAQREDGSWILTGTTLRTGTRHGVELWTSPDR